MNIAIGGNMRLNNFFIILIVLIGFNLNCHARIYDSISAKCIDNEGDCFTMYYPQIRRFIRGGMEVFDTGEVFYRKVSHDGKIQSQLFQSGFVKIFGPDESIELYDNTGPIAYIQWAINFVENKKICTGDIDKYAPANELRHDPYQPSGHFNCRLSDSQELVCPNPKSDF